MKTCTNCGENKEISEFHKDKSRKDGRRERCKECSRILSAEFRTKNKDKLAAQKAEYRASNKEKISAQKAASYLRNREGIRARAAEFRKANSERLKEKNNAWAKANPEKKKAYDTAYYIANADTIKARSLEWNKANPDKAKARYAAHRLANPELRRIHHNNRRARKLSSGGVLSKGLTEKLFKLQKGKCACCGLSLGDDFHLDHIMPLALGGSNTDDNMQLLTATCNMQKNAKHPIDYMRSKGFLL